MSYTTSLITTKSDCDVLLAIAAKEKSALEVRKVNLVQDKSEGSETAVDTEALLAVVTAELASTDTIIAGLPAGAVKDKYIGKRKTLDARQYGLMARKLAHGSVSVLHLELELQFIEQQLAEVIAFIAAVTARKAEIA